MAPLFRFAFSFFRIPSLPGHSLPISEANLEARTALILYDEAR